MSPRSMVRVRPLPWNGPCGLREQHEQMTSQERSQLTQAIGSESLPLQRAGNLSTAEAAAQPGSSPPRLGALLLVLLVAVFALGDYALPFRDQGRHLWVVFWWSVAALLTGFCCFFFFWVFVFFFF